MTHRFLGELAAARAGASDAPPPGTLHYDLPSLPYSPFSFLPFLHEPAALAYRSVAPGSGVEHRAALLDVLGLVDALGLASTESSAGHWRRVTLHLATPTCTPPTARARHLVLHRPAARRGAVLGITENDRGVDDGREFEALLHDPDGRFEAPPRTPCAPRRRRATARAAPTS